MDTQIILESYTLTIPTLLFVAGFTFTLTLGLFTATTHYVAIVALRIKNYVVGSYLFSWICFMTTLILTIIQLACYGNWICWIAIIIIILSAFIITAIFYCGIRIHWEYLILKSMEKIVN